MTGADPFDTPRMRLRGLGPADEPAYCGLYTDPAVMAQIGPPLQPVAARTRFLRAVQGNAAPDGTQRHWMVLDRDAQSPLGLMAVFLDPKDRTDAEFGVMLVPSAHRKGRARELCHAVFARAFAPGGWGLRRLWVRHAAGHDAVVAVMAAVGFAPGPALDGGGTGEMTRDRWAGACA